MNRSSSPGTPQTPGRQPSPTQATTPQSTLTPAHSPQLGVPPPKLDAQAPSAGATVPGRGRARPKLGGLKLDIAAASAPRGVDMEKLQTVSNGSTHFHGSRSGSLIAFHESTPEDRRGSLLPMGALRDANAPVYSGERGNSLEKNAFNDKHLSVVDERHIDSAIDYATDTQRAPQSPVASVPEGQSGLDDSASAKAAVAKMASQALQKLEASDPAMHAMVKAKFPVIYGLKPDEARLEGVSSSVPGEAGVRGGVKPHEIGAIFVPEEHVVAVKALVDKSGHDIPVSSISSFKP